MKKFSNFNMSMVFVLISFSIISGCASVDRALNKIPDHEFKHFEYKRGGNVTSANIAADNAVRDGDEIEIENVEVDLEYGVINWHIVIEGYKRQITNTEEEDK